MKFPKKSWSAPKSPTGVAEVPEAAMQDAVDEYLAWKHLDYYRVPDSFFRWVAVNAPAGIQKWFRGMFGGRPDNTIIIPVGNGMALALLLELKTQDKLGRAVGKTHGKQKHHEHEWAICRSVDDAIKAIERFEEVAGRVKETTKEGRCV